MRDEAAEDHRLRTKRRRVRPPSARAQAREEEIYAAAAHIFCKHGYVAASLQDIADAVGILKGSLYYYIDSKEDLLFGITKQIHEYSRENLEASQAHEGSAEERIKAFVLGHILSFDMQDVSWVRVFYTEYQFLSGERYDEIVAHRHEYEAHLRVLIDQGKCEGFVCPDVDTWLAATGILTMINSVYMWFQRKGRLSIADVAAGYTRMAVQGLRCPPGHAHG
jgi:AcrR family transcriptional regulator